MSYNVTSNSHDFHVPLSSMADWWMQQQSRLSPTTMRSRASSGPSYPLWLVHVYRCSAIGTPLWFRKHGFQD